MGNIIYHYTNLEGFISIMNHSKGKIGLWMSSVDFMNDKSERISGVKVLSQMVESVETLIGGMKIFTPLFKQLAENEPWKILRYLNQYPFALQHQLILSLSRKRDYLPLWGRYADNGNGVAIGLDEDMLEEALNGSKKTICDVYYTDGTRFDSAQFMDFLKPKIEKGQKHFRDKTKDIQETIDEVLAVFCPLLKDNNFSYEEEVRIIDYARKYDNNIKYRPSKYGIIPYKILELDHHIIKEIIAGPCEEPYLYKKSLIDFYFSNGRNGRPDIFNNSNIPFRK